MIRAVTFDLDGTLIDSTDAIVDSFVHTFETLGLDVPSREAILKPIGHVLGRHFSMLTDHDGEECMAIYREHYNAHACDRTVLLPGAREALEAFSERGLSLAFATSKRRYASELILEHLGVLAFFEFRIGPEDVTRPKPHPEALHKVLKHFGLEGSEMAFIGDTHFDVLAAKEAGVAALAVTTGYETRAELAALEPESIFDSLAEATDYILDRATR